MSLAWQPDQNYRVLDTLFEMVERNEKLRDEGVIVDACHICPSCGKELAEGRDQYGNPRICANCCVERVRQKYVVQDAKLAARRNQKREPETVSIEAIGQMIFAVLFAAVAVTFGLLIWAVKVFIGMIQG